MFVPVSPSSHRRRLSLQEDRGRRLATWSLLMLAVSAVAFVIAGVLGTLLQTVVFDLEDQELLSEAGTWGYVAGLLLLLLMALPGAVGIVLGVRARRLGERRLGITGIVVNAAVASFLVLSVTVNLVLG